MSSHKVYTNNKIKYLDKMFNSQYQMNFPFKKLNVSVV